MGSPLPGAERSCTKSPTPNLWLPRTKASKYTRRGPAWGAGGASPPRPTHCTTGPAAGAPRRPVSRGASALPVPDLPIPARLLPRALHSVSAGALSRDGFILRRWGRSSRDGAAPAAAGVVGAVGAVGAGVAGAPATEILRFLRTMSCAASPLRRCSPSVEPCTPSPWLCDGYAYGSFVAAAQSADGGGGRIPGALAAELGSSGPWVSWMRRGRRAPGPRGAATGSSAPGSSVSPSSVPASISPCCGVSLTTTGPVPSGDGWLSPNGAERTSALVRTAAVS
mmetsp:Transcript_11820/g.33303  ORF Transcript_11820/g.33303 Transcript_11820/m.33303 type:complete len:281 (-) Transcript_11820:2430-3272(-)